MVKLPVAESELETQEAETRGATFKSLENALFYTRRESNGYTTLIDPHTNFKPLLTRHC